MGSVSDCGAAVRRWGVGATFALQMPDGSNTRHQTKAGAAPLRTCLERFAPTAPTAKNLVGAWEAPVYAVPTLPPLPPLQMSVPRGKLLVAGFDRGWFAGYSLTCGRLACCLMLHCRTAPPPHQGTSGTTASTRLKDGEAALANSFCNR